ncbi:hypothetical protein B0H13DRAFT_2284546, partial [Mycena leptocephala]
MAPPVYTVLRRRSLRRPHSTSIAFKYAAGRVANEVTQTVWATRTVTRPAVPTDLAAHDARNNPKLKPKQKPKVKEEPRGQHTYRADGLLEVNPLGAHPIPELIERAEAAWAAKLARASTTLRQAASEYTRRYGRLPPRGFDKWWAYASTHNIPLPDEYDQIDRDLAPFYGVAPADLQATQRAWEAHADSYTIGKDTEEGRLGMLNFTLPENEAVRFELATGGFQIIELLKEVEADLPPFRAVFSPHDNPNLVIDSFPFLHYPSFVLPVILLSSFPPSTLSPAPFLPFFGIPTDYALQYELRQQALDAPSGDVHRPLDPPPAKHGWLAACPPLSRAWLDVDALPPPFDDARPNGGPPSVPGGESLLHPLFVVSASLSLRISCDRRLPELSAAGYDTLEWLHPAHLRAHGAYLAHGAGPSPQQTLIPQFSYSVTPLHADIRAAMPLNWVPDDVPNEGRTPPLGLAWAERVDARLQWRGSNTGIWHARDGRWREAHRMRLAALGAGMGGGNVSVLDPGLGDADVDALAEDEYGLGLGFGGGRFGFRAQGGGEGGGGEGEWGEEDRAGGKRDEDGDARKGKRKKKPVGPPRAVPRARVVPALLDVAFAGRPLNCEPEQCDVLAEMFEWRQAHNLQKAGRYKYVLD